VCLSLNFGQQESLRRWSENNGGDKAGARRATEGDGGHQRRKTWRRGSAGGREQRRQQSPSMKSNGERQGAQKRTRDTVVLFVGRDRCAGREQRDVAAARQLCRQSRVDAAQANGGQFEF